MRLRVLVTGIIVLVLVVADPSWAVMKASDVATNAAYIMSSSGAWLGTNPTPDENPPGSDNGGFGFQPWNFGGGYHIETASPYGRLNHFIDGVDFAASSFNDLGSPAFGLTNAQAQYGITANARRRFNQPMQIGDTLSFDFDSPAELDAFAPGEYPFAIISLRDAEGKLTFLIEGGSSRNFGDYNWRMTDGSVTQFDTGIHPLATSDGSSFVMTVTAADQAELVFDGQMFPITFQSGIPTSLQLTLTGNTSGDGDDAPTGEREFFFNNLAIESQSQGLPGDFHQNGLVNGADFLAWQRGDSPDPFSAADLAEWRENYGIAPILALVATVPEPSAILLMIGAVIPVVVRSFSRDHASPIAAST